MNKQDLINQLANASGLSKADTGRVLDALVDTIQAATAAGEEVSIPGVGKFSVRVRAARVGRNPRTGEEVEIAARRVPMFSAAKAFKEAANG